MLTSRDIILLCAGAIVLSGSTPEVFAQGTDNFKVVIPKKPVVSTDPFIPIGEVKAIVSLSTSDPVTFKFRDQRCMPAPAPCTNEQVIGPVSPGGAAPPSVNYPQPESG